MGYSIKAWEGRVNRTYDQFPAIHGLDEISDEEMNDLVNRVKWEYGDQSGLIREASVAMTDSEKSSFRTKLIIAGVSASVVEEGFRPLPGSSNGGSGPSDGGDGSFSFLSHPLYRAGAWATMVAGAYHGYKRNCNSYGWGLGWAMLGGSSMWPIMAAFMLAQGFAKPHPKKIC